MDKNIKKKDVKVTLIIPILNEIKALKIIIPLLDRKLFHDIIIIDGKSTDGSVEFLIQKGFKNIITQSESGLGNAIMEAINHSKTDYVLEFSPDGNCNPIFLKEIIYKVKYDYDLIVVSRYKDGSKSLDDTLITLVGNFMFSKMFSLLGKNKITDALNIYRCFKKSSFNWDTLMRFNKGPVFEPLTTGLAQINNLSIFEIVGDEPKRIGGETKMRIFYNGFSILILWLKLLLYKFLK